MTTFESRTGIYQLKSVSYRVASLTNPDASYDVTVTDSGWQCSCPDAKWRRHECKHIGMARQGKVDSKPHARIMPLPNRARDLEALNSMYTA